MTAAERLVFRADVDDVDDDDLLWHSDPTCHIGPSDRVEVSLSKVRMDVRKCRYCGDFEDESFTCPFCEQESEHPWQCSECGESLINAHPHIDSLDGGDRP